MTCVVPLLHAKRNFPGIARSWFLQQACLVATSSYPIKGIWPEVCDKQISCFTCRVVTWFTLVVKANCSRQPVSFLFPPFFSSGVRKGGGNNKNYSSDTKISMQCKQGNHSVVKTTNLLVYFDLHMPNMVMQLYYLLAVLCAQMNMPNRTDLVPCYTWPAVLRTKFAQCPAHK